MSYSHPPYIHTHLAFFASLLSTRGADWITVKTTSERESMSPCAVRIQRADQVSQCEREASRVESPFLTMRKSGNMDFGRPCKSLVVLKWAC